MTDADVTRSGSQGRRPGSEAKVWTGGSDGHPVHDHPNSSYYGKPIINAPVWEEREIAGYLFAGGLAGASSLIALGADLSGRDALAARMRVGSSVAITASFGALIYDLGRPTRFVNMLRTFKPTSPMSVGTWILSAYAPLNYLASASTATGRAPRTGRAAGAGAAGLAPLVATYTAALFAATSVPAWREARRELPYLFAGSAASAGAGLGLVLSPRGDNAPLVSMAAAGVAGELVADRLMERRLGMVAETYSDGVAGKRMRTARALSVAGAVGAVAAGRRSRTAAVASGAALVAGSALTRFGVFAAGMASARDPKYTVEPQRERLRARG